MQQKYPRPFYFLDEFEQNLDAEGRLIITKLFREHSKGQNFFMSPRVPKKGAYLEQFDIIIQIRKQNDISTSIKYIPNRIKQNLNEYLESPLN